MNEIIDKKQQYTFSTEEIDKISIMRDDGRTTKEIAAAFGVPEHTMSYWIKLLIECGEIGRLKQHQKWTDDRVEELIRLRREGVEMAEIGKKLGVSSNAVMHQIKKLAKEGRLEVGRQGGRRPRAGRKKGK